jgi:hypothetical protein
MIDLPDRASLPGHASAPRRQRTIQKIIRADRR